MKCSGDSGIQHDIVRDTSRKSEKHELIRECVWAGNGIYSGQNKFHLTFNTIH